RFPARTGLQETVRSGRGRHRHQFIGRSYRRRHGERRTVRMKPTSENLSSDVEGATPYILRALGSGTVLAAMHVTEAGLVVELTPAFAPARIYSAPPSKNSDKLPPADAAPDLSVGETELSTESTNLPGMKTPETAKLTDARGPIGGQEAPLDLP